MSEEPPPPSLRLKPRLRPPEETAAAGSAQPPAEPAPAAAVTPPATPPAEPAAAETAAPKLRLKPKLSAEPAATPAQTVAPETPAAVPDQPAPATETAAAQPERPRLKPRLTVEPQAATQPAEATPASAPESATATPAPATAPAPVTPPAPESTPAEPVKFKLKPKAPPTGGTQPPMAVPPPPAAKPGTRPPVEAPAAGVSVPPFLVKPGTTPPMPKPAASASRPPMDAQALADKAPPPPPKVPVKLSADATAKKQKTVILLVVLAVVLVLGVGGYFAWSLFMKPAPGPAADQPVTKTAPADKPAAVTPSETLNQIAAMPKAMVDKAQAAVAARRGNEQERVDAVLEGKEPPDDRFLNTPLPGELGGKPAAPTVTPPAQTYVKTESQLAPGIKVTTSELMANAPVSDEFRAFVSAARINGVFQGNPPRALINGRTIRAGESADTILGIVFDSVDADKKTITFKDRTGATITRKY